MIFLCTIRRDQFLGQKTRFHTTTQKAVQQNQTGSVILRLRLAVPFSLTIVDPE